MLEDEFQDGRNSGGDLRAAQQRLAEIMDRLIPPQPRACFHCEQSMIACVYISSRKVCQRCLLEGRICFEDRKLRWGPTEHALIREITNNEALAELAARQVAGRSMSLSSPVTPTSSIWSVSTGDPSGGHDYEVSSEPSRAPSPDEGMGNFEDDDDNRSSHTGGSRLDTVPLRDVSSSPPPCKLNEERHGRFSLYGDDDSSQVPGWWGTMLRTIAGSVAANSSGAHPGTPSPPEVAPEAWVLCSRHDDEVHVKDVTWESGSAMGSRSQPSLDNAELVNEGGGKSAYASGATSRTDLHTEPGRTDPSSLVNAGFRAHTLPDQASCPSQEDNTWEGPASHTHDESGDEWYPVAADNGVISRSMTIDEVAIVLSNHGCTDLTHELRSDMCGKIPASTGGFGDVYSGWLKNGNKVAIKISRSRPIHEQNRESLQQVAKELHTWSKCQHLNVLELLGFVEFQARIGMVSLWMENGHVRKYLDRYSNIDRCQLCYGISDGLAYLHSVKIVHGDLKGANVLVSDNGTPKLTDFGNSVLQDSSVRYTNTNHETAFTLRWTAPEIMDGRTGHSYSGDVFALGMTLLETITGAQPYQEFENDCVVVMAIVVKKEFPERPTAHIPTDSGQGDTLWALLTKCWAYDPEERPSAAEVRDRMKNISCEGLKGSN